MRTHLQLVIETVAGTNKRGYTAIDDFVFVAGDECALKPSYARPAELGHDCSFDDGLCGQWYEIYLPGESFWNLTSGKDLEAMGIDGPIVDAHDSKDGMLILPYSSTDFCVMSKTGERCILLANQFSDFFQVHFYSQV